MEPFDKDPVIPTGATMRGIRETLWWALDLIDMYDARLSKIDPEEDVYSENHTAAKERARRWLKRCAEAEEKTRRAFWDAKNLHMLLARIVRAHRKGRDVRSLVEQAEGLLERTDYQPSPLRKSE